MSIIIQRYEEIASMICENHHERRNRFQKLMASLSSEELTELRCHIADRIMMKMKLEPLVSKEI